ncbi:hypothetical protein TcasGA2_TC034335 [Tribolium castaneum]|uniref:Uncharacterized protein n=1 Tax=Tribolium castaneum TaxID=7070 RepID=A0A139WCD1_TRICA|nr:hypothetical protein TcasGA2_TC034335 [Tribolium castaneum]
MNSFLMEQARQSLNGRECSRQGRQQRETESGDGGRPRGNELVSEWGAVALDTDRKVKMNRRPRARLPQGVSYVRNVNRSRNGAHTCEHAAQEVLAVGGLRGLDEGVGVHVFVAGGGTGGLFEVVDGHFGESLLHSHKLFTVMKILANWKSCRDAADFAQLNSESLLYFAGARDSPRSGMELEGSSCVLGLGGGGGGGRMLEVVEETMGRNSFASDLNTMVAVCMSSPPLHRHHHEEPPKSSRVE